MKKIYVLCPPTTITGGPDALHQMVYYLNLSGFDAKICYIRFSKLENCYIPNPYKVYIDDFTYIDQIQDSEDVSIIVPESACWIVKRFKNAKIYLWWLSVDNNLKRSSILKKIIYILTLPLRVYKHRKFYAENFMTKVMYNIFQTKYSFDREKQNIVHLCASYYAYDYVFSKTSNPVYLAIEPISKIFLDKYKLDTINTTMKKNIVIYNPVKCGQYVQQLKKNTTKIEFVPLIGLTQNELIKKYKEAKLYIDFGPFPGAERMPKEAVLYNCAILTGNHGASGYYSDVPIDNKYKLDESKLSLQSVNEKIIEMVNNYDEIISDFEKYKKTVIYLELNFINAIVKIFGGENENHNM